MTQTYKVYEAIAAVMQSLSKDGIAKDRQNQQQRYKFRGIDDVYNALSKTLAEHKLCILPRVKDRQVTERTTKNGATLFYTTLTVDFDLVSAEDGSKHTICTVGEAMDSADKSSNKAMSAAYKYACLQTFCIPTEAEEAEKDADATTHEVAPKDPTPPSQPASKADSRDIYDRLVTAVREQKTLSDFNRWLDNPHVVQAIKSLPQDWCGHFAKECAAKEDEMKAAEMPDNNPFVDAAE